MAKTKKKRTSTDVEQLEYTAGRNVNGNNHFGKLFGEIN